MYYPIVVVAIAQQPTVDLLLSVGVRAAPVAKVGWIRRCRLLACVQSTLAMETCRSLVYPGRLVPLAPPAAVSDGSRGPTRV